MIYIVHKTRGWGNKVPTGYFWVTLRFGTLIVQLRFRRLLETVLIFFFNSTTGTNQLIARITVYFSHDGSNRRRPEKSQASKSATAMRSEPRIARINADKVIEIIPSRRGIDRFESTRSVWRFRYGFLFFRLAFVGRAAVIKYRIFRNAYQGSMRVTSSTDFNALILLFI